MILFVSELFRQYVILFECLLLFCFQYVCDWLDEVAKTHFEVIVSCLLPHPAEYARVGGFWSVSAIHLSPPPS